MKTAEEKMAEKTEHWAVKSPSVLKKAKAAADGKVHLSEPALDSCQISTRVKLEVKYKILQKFALPGDSLATAARRMIDASVKDVKLTAENLAKIEAEMKESYEKRMVRRYVNFGGRGRGGAFHKN